MKKTALVLFLMLALLIPSVANAGFSRSYRSDDPVVNYTYFLLTVYSPDNNQTCKSTMLLNFTVDWREYPTFAGLPSPPAPVMKGLYSYTIDNNTAVTVASNQSSADQFDVRGFKVNPTFSYLLDVSNLTNGYHKIVITVGLTINYDDVARYINKDTSIQFFVTRTEETIYIRTDGSVEGTDKIQRDGNVYTFTGNIYCPIFVEKDDVVVDGAGYTLEGDGENIGINLNERSGVKIKNIHFLNWWCGIANFGNNCTIEGNWINGGNMGIQLKFAGRCTIIGNELLDNFIDVDLIDSYDNNITGNSIGRLVWSIWFQHSPGDNYFDGNYWKNYKGVDDNGDGIGDTPFKVYWLSEDKDVGCYDNNPLMKPIVVPEFPSWTPLLIALGATVAVAIIYRRKLQNRGRWMK